MAGDWKPRTTQNGSGWHQGTNKPILLFVRSLPCLKPETLSGWGFDGLREGVRSLLGEVMVIWITTNVLYDSSLVSESWNGNPNHRRSLIMGSGMKWIRVLAPSPSHPNTHDSKPDLGGRIQLRVNPQPYPRFFDVLPVIF